MDFQLTYWINEWVTKVFVEQPPLHKVCWTLSGHLVCKCLLMHWTWIQCKFKCYLVSLANYLFWRQCLLTSLNIYFLTAKSEQNFPYWKCIKKPYAIFQVRKITVLCPLTLSSCNLFPQWTNMYCVVKKKTCLLCKVLIW